MICLAFQDKPVKPCRPPLHQVTASLHIITLYDVRVQLYKGIEVFHVLIFISINVAT